MTANRILTRTAMLRGGVASIASSAAVLALSRSASLAASAPIVETTHGKLRGTATSGVYAFKGIRYGATTAGANRFRPPQPLS